MAPTYAAPGDLATYLDDVAPTNSVVLLRHASGLVARAIRGALYDADPTTGVPTDSTLLEACTNATCAQAAAWYTNGIDPIAGRSAAPKRVQQKSGGGVSVTYETDPRDAREASDLASGDVLGRAALQYLDEVGLLTTRVQGWTP